MGQAEAVGAGSGAIQGAMIGTQINPGLGTLIGAIIGAAIGDGVAALGTALADKGPKSKRRGIDYIETQSIRNTVVPVPFGRNRLGGNWIAVGAFAVTKDNKSETRGRRLRRVRAILALSEGVIQKVGNFRQDGQTLKALARYEEATVAKGFQYVLSPGTNDQTLPPLLSAPPGGFLDEPHIPWRNTAFLSVYAIVGDRVRMPEVNCDSVGIDTALRRSGTLTPVAGAGLGDSARYAFYDGHTESFYFVPLNTADVGDSGLIRVPRAAAGRDHQRPPAGFAGGSVLKAWYVGRHDVLVMQDRVDPGKFHVGYWGIAAGSDEWEAFRPDGPDGGAYGNDMLAWHLDEVHCMLHSVHQTPEAVGVELCVMRWNLLTGRVERVDLQNVDTSTLGGGGVSALCYSPDLDAYLLTQSTKTSVIDPYNGRTTSSTNALDTAGALGILVTGHQVGVVKAGAINYYDVNRESTTGPYGKPDAGLAVGELGGIVSACQNTWTGHVTVVKPWVDGGVVFINFIPSVPEHALDVNANGTSGIGSHPPPEDPEDDFQSLPIGITVETRKTAFARNWSFRHYFGYQFSAFGGNSSLAGAMWTLQVDTPNVDSRRWGASQREALFSLSSFEGLHWYCVGPVSMVSPDNTRRLAERYKFDFLLDGEQSVASLVSDQMLVCCNGYRVVIGGKMHVGVPKPGGFPLWHFNDKNISPPGLRTTWFGRGAGVNKVRVLFRKVLSEYQHGYAEANDEFDQDHRRRIQAATIQAEGCGREGHAELLAHAILDQSLGGRRQFNFKTHFVGFLVCPTDPIDVSNAQQGMDRIRAKIVARKEEEGDGEVEISAVEHKVAIEVLPKKPETDYAPGLGTVNDDDDDCAEVVAPTDGATNWMNGGAAYATGTYTITYLGGTYAPTNDGTVDNHVAGFSVVTLHPTTGAIVVLAATPGTHPAGPGFATSEDALVANANASVTFTQTVFGPIGIAYPGGAPVFPGVNEDGEPELNPPAFTVCLGTATGTPTLSSSSGTSGSGSGSLGSGSDVYVDPPFVVSSGYVLVSSNGSVYVVPISSGSGGSGSPVSSSSSQGNSGSASSS